MMHRRTPWLRRVLATLVILPAVSVAAGAQEPASYVVLASTAPAFSVGALVDEDSTLEVPHGASLTLIDAVGVIKVIKGPFLGRLHSDVDDDPESSSFLSDLAAIVAEAQSAEAALGLGRGGILAPEVSPWLVAFDHALSTDLCVSPDGQLVFYRPEEAYPGLQSVRFSTADGSAEATVSWATDDQLLRWPSELPPQDGGAYLIDAGAATQPPQVSLHLVPAELASDAHVAVWLARSGCATQAQAMVRRMSLGG